AVLPLSGLAAEEPERGGDDAEGAGEQERPGVVEAVDDGTGDDGAYDGAAVERHLIFREHSAALAFASDDIGDGRLLGGVGQSGSDAGDDGEDEEQPDRIGEGKRRGGHAEDEQSPLD